MMKFTEDNTTIVHEIGHFIFFTLFLSSKNNFGKEMFCENVAEISIIPDYTEKSLGYISINDLQLKNNKLCCYFVLLSGVLTDLLIVNHKWNTDFNTVRNIRDNYVGIYCDHGGSKDLKRVFDMRNTINSIPYHIFELKKIIYYLWDQEIIRKITRKLYRRLQKEKILYSESCYSIIEPYIPELIKLGRDIYGIKTKLRINARTILFQ